MDELAITVDSVNKTFKLPHEKQESIKSAIINIFRSKKGYEQQQAINDITFDVKKGEFFGIVGRNGSGKSTLLKIIAGIYQPTTGKIQVAGRLVPFIELGVGFNPELTGRENVYLNGAMLGFSNNEVKKMYEEIVEFAELERFMDQKLKNYSSGMQVRLAFSMAIRAEADVLLIDEVLAVGDADFQRKCFEYFKSLKRKNVTVIFVSHDMDSIREYCDRAVVVENSRIVFSGSAYDAAAKYTKMFSGKGLDDSSNSASKNRWGNEYANVSKTEVTLLDNKSKIEITNTVEFKDRLSGPIVGMLVKNTQGKVILGTNTKIKKIKLGTYSRGDKINIKWTVPNIFADGAYQVDVAVLEGNGITVCDWLENAKSFKVIKDERTPYDINPPIEVKVDA